MARWVVYLLRCRDRTLYCGITNNLERRLAAHRAGRGARYTRGRGPLQVVHVENARGRSDALRREIAWKRLSRAEKLRRIRAKALSATAGRGRGSPPRPRKQARRP